MADYPDRPGYSFDPGPPPEASRFLRNKGLRPSFAWDDVEPEEHAVAFTAAKMTEIDLIEAARAEVQKALDEGLPFKAFQKNWKDRPALAEWLGKREYTDPATGEVVEVKRSPARRLRVIYDSNLRSARAAGQWERIERTKDAFPYLEYRLGASEVHRPKHAEKAGKIIAVDSPFWDDWMPPNGWGCKCWVRQVTKREAERRGIDAAPDVPEVKVENLKTGALAFVPQGIDPGWHRNPGKLRRESMDALLAGKIEELPEAVAKAALKDLATSWQVVRIMDGAEGRAPVGLLSAEMALRAGLDEKIIWVNADTFEHLATEKSVDLREVAFRKSLMAAISDVGKAALGAIETRADGNKTLRILVPFNPAWTPAQSKKAGKSGRPTLLVLWFDDGLRVRTISPTTEDAFRRQAAERDNELIDLEVK